MSLSEIAFYIAPLIGFVTLIIGTAAVLKPAPMSKNFGIEVSGSALPYVVSTGIRDIFMGLTILILFSTQHHQQDRRTLGAIHLCVGVVAISDFLIVQKHGDKKTSWVHLLGAVAVIGYGVWLIFQSSLA